MEKLWRRSMQNHFFHPPEREVYVPPANETGRWASRSYLIGREMVSKLSKQQQHAPVAPIHTRHVYKKILFRHAEKHVVAPDYDAKTHNSNRIMLIL